MSPNNHLSKGSDVKPYEALFAGSLSGAVARAITAPLDTVKIRLQLQKAAFKNSKSAVAIARDILQKEGVAGFWKGNVPAEIMYILYGSVQFTSYAVLSNGLSSVENKLNVNLSSSTHSLAVGTGTGMVSTIATYPFDLLRTRLAANTDSFLSMLEHTMHILRTEGIKGYFVGIEPAMLSVASTMGIMFWAYEVARDVTKKYNEVPFIEGICGFIAGGASKGATFPLDTLRKRVQMHKMTHGTNTTALALLSNILRNEGLFGVYKGFGISLLKTAPTSAFSLWIYELTITWMRRNKKEVM